MRNHLISSQVASMTQQSARKKFELVHKKLAGTRDERMLNKHGKYEQTWSRQMQSATEVRDALPGRVNDL